jgi:alpha-1,2-mannosyltransferase
VVVDALRAGSWLTRTRIRAYLVIIIAVYAASLAAWAVSGSSSLANGLPFGCDFISVYAASHLLLGGAPEAAYDWQRHHAAEHALVEFDSDKYFGWHYPPPALLLVAPLAALPFLGAVVVWIGLTLAGYLAALRAILPHPLVIAAALGFTASFVNLIHGQNGFLTTGLLGGACVMLQRNRPWVAGALIALLLYKPQFGVLIPVALIAGGHWRTVVAASVLGLAFLALSYVLLGPATWQAFLASTDLTRDIVLEQGGAGWHKIQSVFSMVRMAGGDTNLAYALQGATLLTLGTLVALAWARREAPFAIKAALLAAGSLYATPYVLDYDLVVLALVVAWFAADGLERGFLPWDKTALACLFLWPIVSRLVAVQFHVQLTPIVLGVLVFVIYRRLGPMHAPLQGRDDTGSATVNR